jgi:hypothetical protein
MLDWKNIDLESNYEKEQTFLDGYSFETLLLEISTNFRIENITEKKVFDYIESEMNKKIECAKDVIRYNIKNIVAKAIEEKNIE